MAGVELEDGPAKVDSFRLVDAVGKTAQIEIVLHEGRKHIVRRMMDEVGHPVNRLVRTAIGPIRLGDLKPGSHPAPDQRRGRRAVQGRRRLIAW